MKTLALAILVGLAPLCLPPTATAQEKKDTAEKKVLTVDDYGRWRRAGSVQLSADGAWMSYGYTPNDGDGELYVERLDGKPIGDAEEGEPRLHIERGSSPAFSNDSRWFTCRVLPKGTRAPAGRRFGGGPPGSGGGDDSGPSAVLQLIDLTTGTTTEYDNASSATFSEDSAWLLLRKPRGDSSAKHRGADLLAVNLATGSTRNLGNVSAFALNEEGTLLAFTVDAADQHGNGLYLLDLASDTVRALDTAQETYAQMGWDEEGDHLACLAGNKDDQDLRRSNRLLVVKDAGSRREELIHYAGAAAEGFPEGMTLSELTRPSFSEDGRMVFLGLKEQEPDPDYKEKKKPARPDSEKDDAKPAAPRNGDKKDEERPNVDVWHWADDTVQSIQERRAGRARNNTWSAVLHLADLRLVRLEDEELESVSIAGKGRWGIGRDDRRYRHEITWGGSRADYYRVDLDTGERKLITETLGRPIGTSPNGRWYVFLKGGLVWSHDLDTGTTHNLTKDTGVDFVNHDDDHPYEKPAYGVAGWSKDETHVVLNHKYDLWVLPLAGGEGTCLTRGVGDREDVRFRMVVLDREEEFLDLGAPLLLSSYGEWTKKSGFHELLPGQEPRPLYFEDVATGRPIKAKDADVVALTIGTFEQYHDYHVTNTRFEKPRKITDTNPQQAEYHWGRRVLVDYENQRGVRLQGTLTLPANYEEGKQYPMLVYFYELMSQRHHQYSQPTFDDRPHMSTYASDGYLVLMPDVVYLPGRPGDCAVDCVTSAVQKVIDLGYADSDRIVLQGHSWGGYQSSFILTQTDMFCAVVTGAPVTNLVSFYGELYKSSGSVQQGITEVGQVRMGTTPWENMELFHSQSPLHNVEHISTPFIILHGTDDGSVDWHQGLEYYNAARRNGKEVILLSYPGEGHHLSKKANQVDFQVRMKQFFDHYCKGTDAPLWMTEGVPYLERDKAKPTDMPEEGARISSKDPDPDRVP